MTWRIPHDNWWACAPLRPLAVALHTSHSPAARLRRMHAVPRLNSAAPQVFYAALDSGSTTVQSPRSEPTHRHSQSTRAPRLCPTPNNCEFSPQKAQLGLHRSGGGCEPERLCLAWRLPAGSGAGNAWSLSPPAIPDIPLSSCRQRPPGELGVRKAAWSLSVVFPIIFLRWENCWCEMTAMLTPQPLSLAERIHTLVAGVRGGVGSLCSVESRHIAPVHWGLGARCRPVAWPTAPDSDSSPVGMGWLPPLGGAPEAQACDLSCLRACGGERCFWGTDPAQQPACFISWVLEAGWEECPGLWQMTGVPDLFSRASQQVVGARLLVASAEA